MTVVLDGGQIRTREDLHNALERGLSLPEWYGRNLDALYDCLCDVGEETEIILRRLPLLREALGRYGETLIRVLRDAGAENGQITLTIEETEEDTPEEPPEDIPGDVPGDTPEEPPEGA